MKKNPEKKGLYTCKNCKKVFETWKCRNPVFCSMKCCYTYNTGKNNVMYGRKFSRPYLKGKTFEEIHGYEKAKEIKLAMSRALKGKKILNPRSGFKISEVHKRKVSLGVKKLWQNPEYREHMSECHKGFTMTQKSKIAQAKSAQIHKNSILQEMSVFEHKGYRCFPTGVLGVPCPDFVAVKNGKAFAVEVEYGNIRPDRYSNCKYYDDIIWIKKTHEVDGERVSLKKLAKILK